MIKILLLPILINFPTPHKITLSDCEVGNQISVDCTKASLFIKQGEWVLIHDNQIYPTALSVDREIEINISSSDVYVVPTGSLLYVKNK